MRRCSDDIKEATGDGVIGGRSDGGSDDGGGDDSGEPCSVCGSLVAVPVNAAAAAACWAVGLFVALTHRRLCCMFFLRPDNRRYRRME